MQRNHPFAFCNIAEDTVTVDLLSGGRLEVGLGTGTTPETFLAFGIEKVERADVFARKLDMLHRAWSGAELGHPQNRLYPAADNLQERTWHATFSVAGAERIGKAGAGLMLSRTQPRSAERPDATLPEIQNPIVDAYSPISRQASHLGSHGLRVLGAAA